MRHALTVLLLAALLLAGGFFSKANADGSADIPVEVFGALPDFESPKLSPNGEHMGFMTTIQGRKIAFFQKRDGSEMLAAPPIEEADIVGFHWATDDRILLIYEFSLSRKQFTGISTETRLAGVDRNGQNFKWIVLPRKIKSNSQNKLHREYPPAQLQHIIPSLLPRNPDEILISIDSDQNGEWEIRRVNIHTGKFRLARAEMRGIQNWTLGPDDEVRLATGYVREKHFAYIRPAAGHWKKLKDQAWWKTYDVLGFSDDPDIIYVSGPSEHGTIGLYTLNLQNGRIIKELFSHPHVDVSELVFAPHSKNVIGVTYTEDLPKTYYFDSEYAEIQKQISKPFAGKSIQIVDKSQTRSIYIFRVSSDRDPGKYYWFNQDSNKIGAIFPVRKAINADQMARVKSVEITTRDGTLIPAYLTAPIGRARKNLPLVVLPHGGPRGVRDTAEWDFWTQFLASRGYAVLQPNFRGSGGYGRAFQHAGRKQWGGIMQNDITDATKWAITQGIADPQRICIAGASYGGYSALIGAAKEPSLYQCAISVNGVTDIPALKRNDRDTIGGRAWIKTMGLSGQSDKSVSPFHIAKEIATPVLLLSSLDDARVPYQQSRKMHRRMQKLGKDSTYIEIQNGGHGWDNRQSRLTVLRATEEFLAKHIGRSPQQIALN